MFCFFVISPLFKYLRIIAQFDCYTSSFIYFLFIPFFLRLANMIAYYCVLWKYYFYFSLGNILVFFFFSLPITAHFG